VSNSYKDKDELDEQLKEVEAKANKKSRKVKKTTSKSLMQIVNGDFLSREFVVGNLTYIFFLVALLIVLVAKGYYVKQMTRSIDSTRKGMDEVTADYVAASAELEEKTTRIELLQQLKGTGVRETMKPPKVIRIKKEQE